MTGIIASKKGDTMKEMNVLWENVTKQDMVQFKLKVQKRREGAVAKKVADSNDPVSSQQPISQSTLYGDAIAESQVFQSSVEKSGAESSDQ